MRILILEQQPDAPAQLLGDWARARGHRLEVARVPECEQLPDPAEFDAVVSLGSEHSVHGSPYAWIEREVRYLAKAHGRGLPILGICFGAQALAKAVGAEVSRAEHPEVGWRSVESCDGRLIAPGPWFRWHYDRFTAPDGACVLARDGEEVDAFAIGRSLGVQFHPEADVSLAQKWIDDGHADLRSSGVDLDVLKRQIADHGAGARERAFDLFDRIETWWLR